MEHCEKLMRLRSRANNIAKELNSLEVRSRECHLEILQKPLEFVPKEEENPLHVQLNTLKHQIREKDSILLPIVQDISRIESPRLATIVYNKLPRELRDQVYGWLWDKSALHMLESRIATRHRAIQSQPDEDWKLYVPIFANADFVGEQFAREAALLYFQMLMKAEVDYRMLEDFLDIKKFGPLELRPIEVMRTLTISIDFKFGEGCRHLHQKTLQSGLNRLLVLEARNGFAIKIYLSRDMQFTRILFQALEIIRPVYNALVKKGVKIKVLGYRFFTPRWRREDEPRSRPTCTTEELLNYYFKQTPEEWLDMKEREIQAIKQPMRRLRCMEILNNMRLYQQDFTLDVVV